MNLRAAAKARGGDVVRGRHGQQILAPGPGHSRHDRSLSVIFMGGDLVVNSFAGDDPLICKDHVRRLLGMPEWRPGAHRTAPARAKPNLEEENRPMTPDELERVGMARDVWDKADDPRGTLVEQYLRSRALALPDDLAGTVLRFHPRCTWRDENSGRTIRIPALVAAFRNIDTDEITTVHRMRLDQPERWPKIDRRMFGIVRRGAVKLAPVGTELAIGEGIETCMAAREMGMEFPVWALGSCGSIAFFPIIPGVKCLILIRENDPANLEAVKSCGTRWKRAGIRVRTATPVNGNDMNDALMAEASAR
jgi:putative DNA primase/helicase